MPAGRGGPDELPAPALRNRPLRRTHLPLPLRLPAGELIGSPNFFRCGKPDWTLFCHIYMIF
ncbi:hypothetical protein OAK48_01685 [Deltaproteobacteria bacterium]|nr:hypothetical protein [Deltaproteobacteria bacterium]